MNEENVMEKQLMSFLIQKHQTLRGEIKKIEMALDALNVDTSLFQKIDPLDPEFIKKNTHVSDKNALTNTPEYIVESKLDTKIAFALSQSKDLSKDAILDIIIAKQPGYDRYKFEKTLSVRLSYLLKHKLIDGKKEGRSYVYSLTS